MYKYLKKTYRYSPKTVAEKVLNGTASYDDLSRREGFTAEDFIKAWKPIFERTDRDCTIPTLNIIILRFYRLYNKSIRVKKCRSPRHSVSVEPCPNNPTRRCGASDYLKTAM